MKNSFQKISLLVSVAILLVLGLAFVFLYQKINENNNKTQQDSISMQTETNRRSDIQSLNKLIQKISPDKDLLESHFIKSSDVVPFFDTIEKLSDKAGVSAQIDSVDTKTDSSGLIVGMKISGKFEAIYKFITLLENSTYVLDFISMDVHKPQAVVGKNIDSSNWEAVFKIQLLSYIP